jgi:ribonuclease III
LSLVHSSMAKENSEGFRESNERLEYLGDAILGAVVADYLFKRFPYKDEGFLTEIRSRIVSREALNTLARKIGLNVLVDVDAQKHKGMISYKSIYGDAMEAFVGAIYLDRGFKPCRRFIVSKLIENHYDMTQVVLIDTNYKSRLIEWAQKMNKQIRFEPLELESSSAQKQFKVQILLNDEIVSTGTGYTKKKAEQDAARRFCESIQL